MAIAGIALPDLPRLVGEYVPDRQSFAIIGHSPLDLVTRCCCAPDKILWKSHKSAPYTYNQMFNQQTDIVTEKMKIQMMIIYSLGKNIFNWVSPQMRYIN
jgi:hypothetical protein